MGKMIKVLQVGIGGKEFSGVSNWWYENYSIIDHTKVHWDFVFCRENMMALKQDSEVLSKSKIIAFDLNIKTKNKIREYLLFYKKLDKFLRINSYDIVHICSGSYLLQSITTYLSKKNKVGTCIAHSHNAHNKKSGTKQTLLYLLSPFFKTIINKNADYRLACSKMAGDYLFGKNEKFKILRNGINVNQYSYNKNIRDTLRLGEKLSEENIVFYFAGRLAKNKNLIFLLDIFYELYKSNNNMRLWLIGEGEMRETIRKKIKEDKLDNVVKLWGERMDVPILLQGCDVLLFPSFFEGLSYTVIEAQAAGLPVFASDTISEEHDVTGLVKFLSLEKSAKEWAKYIEKRIRKYKREDQSKKLITAGYDIRTTACWLEKFYRKCSVKP